MKICVSTYSFGKYITKEGFGIFGAVDFAKENGFDGIEIVDGMHENCSDLELAKKVKSYCEEKGLEVASFCTAADFLFGSGEDLDAEIKRVCSKVDLAAAYGAKTQTAISQLSSGIGISAVLATASFKSLHLFGTYT